MGVVPLLVDLRPILAVLCVAWPLFVLYMLLRICAVSRYRSGLIRRIHVTYSLEIEQGARYAPWRWELFEQITFDAMLLRFWRPVSSFYYLPQFRLSEQAPCN